MQSAQGTAHGSHGIWGGSCAFWQEDCHRVRRYVSTEMIAIAPAASSVVPPVAPGPGAVLCALPLSEGDKSSVEGRVVIRRRFGSTCSDGVGAGLVTIFAAIGQVGASCYTNSES